MGKAPQRLCSNQCQLPLIIFNVVKAEEASVKAENKLQMMSSWVIILRVSAGCMSCQNITSMCVQSSQSFTQTCLVYKSVECVFLAVYTNLRANHTYNGGSAASLPLIFKTPSDHFESNSAFLVQIKF